jgi:hypothetical protein
LVRLLVWWGKNGSACKPPGLDAIVKIIHFCTEGFYRHCCVDLDPVAILTRFVVLAFSTGGQFNLLKETFEQLKPGLSAYAKSDADIEKVRG